MHQRKNDDGSEGTGWVDEVGRLPAQVLAALPLACELQVAVPGARGVRTGIRVLTGVGAETAGSEAAVENPQLAAGGAADLRLDGRAWAALARAVAADRFTAADLEALCEASEEDAIAALDDASLLAGVSTEGDAERLSVAAVLGRLGAELQTVRLVEATTPPVMAEAEPVKAAAGAKPRALEHAA